MNQTVHTAITRKVKPGCEDEFESAIQSFFKHTLSDSNSMGAQLIRPLPGSKDSTYGILRSFISEDARDTFYRSDAFLEWNRSIQHLVEPEYTRQEFHGLEAFFSNLAAPLQPPKWKMAFVTWLGVWPSVLLVSLFVSPLMPDLPSWAAMGIDTGIVVLMLSWTVMPFLTKLFRTWLIKEKKPI